MASIIVVLLGLIFIYESLHLTLIQEGVPGTGFFPLLLGLLMTPLGFVIFISTVISKDKETINWPNRSKAQELLLIMLALSLYIFLMHFIGFAISTLFFCAILMRILRRLWWVNALIAGIIISTLLTIILDMEFGVPLPRGELFTVKISTILFLIVSVFFLLGLWSFFVKQKNDKANILQKTKFIEK